MSNRVAISLDRGEIYTLPKCSAFKPFTGTLSVIGNAALEGAVRYFGWQGVSQINNNVFPINILKYPHAVFGALTAGINASGMSNRRLCHKRIQLSQSMKDEVKTYLDSSVNVVFCDALQRRCTYNAPANETVPSTVAIAGDLGASLQEYTEEIYTMKVGS